MAQFFHVNMIALKSSTVLRSYTERTTIAVLLSLDSLCFHHDL